MMIKKDTKCLFLRIPSLDRKTDVIEEHLKTYEKNNQLWIMKMGKKPDINYLNDIIENNGGIIIKKSLKFGNEFFYGNLKSINPTKTIKSFPHYYNDIFNNMGIKIDDTFGEATWFLVENIKKISDNNVALFKTKNDKSLLECANKLFQVSYMFVSPEKDIEV